MSDAAPKAGNQQLQPPGDPRDALNAFRNTCEDLADELVRHKAIDIHLHRLVDKAWHHAVARGYDQLFGVDMVQQVMADAFKRAREEIENASSPPQRWTQAEITGCGPGDPTPQTTINAVICELREFGIAALERKETQARLARCDETALKQIDDFIARLPK